MKNMAKWLWVLAATVLLGVSPALSGCGTTGGVSPLERVTLQLNWYHEVEFAGFYVAYLERYYAGNDLLVTTNEGGIGINEIDLLMEGEADFAVSSSNRVQEMIEDGSPGVVLGNGPTRLQLVNSSLRRVPVRHPKPPKKPST